MELLQGKVKTVYFRYLGAAFGSAMISAVYGIVDMAMVGQYQGPNGTAALAVVAPIWNIVYSLGLLTGIGGSVLFGAARGQNRTDGRENQYFTAALAATALLALVSWVAVGLFDRQLLTLFGAQETLMPIARQYLYPIKFVVPLYLFNQMLAAFLRNDGSPGLATAAVLSGGVINIFGDYLFVFALDLGAMGAGLATALCAVITTGVMLTHFFSKKNTLRLVRPVKLAKRLQQILINGFSPFFIDVAMGILTMLFNRQIMRFAGANELAVYGVIVNISTIVQCCAYSVGQAAQPIISIAFGAQQWDRIKQTLRYALYSVCFFSVFWTVLMLGFPNGFIKIFMAPTEQVLAVAPGIMRCYGLSFLLLPLNIFSTYYFQSLMKPGASFLVSVSRGVIISGLLICLLPLVAGIGALWLAMPVTELVVAGAVIWMMIRDTKGLQINQSTDGRGC